MKKRFLFHSVFLVTALSVQAQGGVVQRLLEEISFQSDVLVNADGDRHRQMANASLTEAMDSLMALPGSFDISLDSIKWLSVLHGDHLRVVTWQYRHSPDEYTYGGYIQTPQRAVKLKDTRPFINGSSYSAYSPSAWYGCLYYKMYPFTRDGLAYYLILGFNAMDSKINIKVADILDLNGSEPRFGAPFFEGEGDPRTRIMLTYADVSTVHMEFDSTLNGLVYDHLENLFGVGPGGEELPVADGSLEAYLLQDGHWTYKEKVYDVISEKPPMTEDRKDRKEDKDLMGRPRKK